MFQEVHNESMKRSKVVTSIKDVKAGHWMAVTRDYKKVISSNPDYSSLKKETANRSDIIYLKLPPTDKAYVFAN